MTSTLTQYTFNYLKKKLIICLVGFTGFTAILLGKINISQASVFYLNTSDSPFTPGIKNQGWWSSRTENIDTNQNYVLFDWIVLYRNFFTFDISVLSNQPILSATLEITRAGENGFPDILIDKIGFFDVSTDVRLLNNNTGRNDDILNDLGTGKNYGNFELSTIGDPIEILRFPLNSTAIADIENAIAVGNQFFSVGGTFLNIDETPPSVRRELFGNSEGTGGIEGTDVQRLTIVTAPVTTSEPPMSIINFLGVGLTVKFSTLFKHKFTKKAKKN